MGLDMKTDIQDFQKGGFNEAQAKTLANKLHREREDDIVTKKDLIISEQKIKSEIQEFRHELKSEIHELRTELKCDILDIRGNIKELCLHNKLNLAIQIIILTGVFGPHLSQISKLFV